MTALTAATDRLLATVAALADRAEEDWAAPSACAGWSRAHVIAHLALNAEGLAGVLRGIATGAPATMYASNEARDADIDALAAETADRVRDRLTDACHEFADASAAAGTIPEGVTFERTPGGQVLAASAIASLRWREVEIHHADLGAGYTFEDWPAATAWTFLVDEATRFDGEGFHLHLTDHSPSGLVVGSPDAGAATVSGPLRALAWWATGRDPGPVLSSTTGTLPTLEGR